MSENDGSSKSGAQPSKGKGKHIAAENTTSAPTTAPEIPPGNASESRSLTSRIAQSGANLASSLLSGRPGADDLAQHSNNATSKAGPAQRPSHPGQALGESLSSALERLPVRSGSDGTFRSGHVQDHVAQQEAAFSNFLDGTDGLHPAPEPAGSSREARDWTAFLDRHDGTNQSDRQQEGSCATAHHLGNDVGHQEAHDGTAVINILTRYEEEPPNYDPELSLSAEEIKKLRAALFGDNHGARTASRDWDHALNFIPDFVRPDQNRDDGQASPNREKTEETYSALGVTHLPEASRIWVEQWEDVLSRYTEEVWGDLMPLVKTAQKELQELEKPPGPGGEQPNTKALDRLRQILDQVRGI